MANNKVLTELHYLISKHQLGALAKSEASVLKNHLQLLVHDIEQAFESFQPISNTPVDPTPAPEQPSEPVVDPAQPAAPAEQPAEPVAPAAEPQVDGEPQA